MYRWDERSTMLAGLRPASPGPAVLARGPEAPGTPAISGRGPRSGTDPARPGCATQTPAARAVQVALDRRDNGGDSSAALDQ